MKLTVSHLLTLIIGLLQYEVYCQSPSDKMVPKECVPWNNYAKRMNAGFEQAKQQEHPMIKVACKDHSKDECQQLDCGGSYNLKLLDKYGLKFDFCFGLTFHDCDSPRWMELNVSIPTFHNTLHKMIKTGNDSFQIPGLNLSIGVGEAAVFLFVNFFNTSDRSYALSVSARVRVTQNFFGETVTEWPDALQMDVISLGDIPVGYCPRTTNHTLKPLRQCNIADYIGPIPTTPPGVMVKPGSNVTVPVKPPTTPPVIIISPTYNKSCIVGSMSKSHCGYGESCGLEGRCVCSYDYQLSSHTGVCKYIGNATNEFIPEPFPLGPSVHHGADAQSSNNSKGVNKTALIVGGTVGGLVIIAVIVTVIIVIKRRQSRYQGRELLLTEDDTDGAI